MINDGKHWPKSRRPDFNSSARTPRPVPSTKSPSRCQDVQNVWIPMEPGYPRPDGHVLVAAFCRRLVDTPRLHGSRPTTVQSGTGFCNKSAGQQITSDVLMEKAAASFSGNQSALTLPGSFVYVYCYQARIEQGIPDPVYGRRKGGEICREIQWDAKV